MNDDDKRMFLALVKGKDISEIMSLLAESGNQYSRRILRFFRWFCKWVPILIMTAHMYGMFDFSRNPKEMFEVHKANWACYAFIYIMVYILPMVIILASRTLLLAMLEVSHTVLLLLRCQLHTSCILELVHDQRDGNGALCNHGVHVVAVCLRSYRLVLL